MSDNKLRKPLAIAVGATFAAAMSASPVVNADTSPFGMQNLSSGYMQVAEGKCGESKAMKDGKCGEGKKMEEGKCGENKAKKDGKCGEGKCGENKAKKEGKCGEGKTMKEGKCGEKE